MFVYLSKRIAMPNGVKVTSIAWNDGQGWLACGGEKGLLKVLKVDGGPQGQRSGGLSSSQTLEGHDTTVDLVTWNQQYCKLTSSDVSGRIIVWVLHKGMWFEEMVNNRNSSRVVDFAWNPSGTKICITYEDGAVIVGGVDGNRYWGRELPYKLAKVCWGADGNSILFGTATGEVYVHDASSGEHLSQVEIKCNDGKAPSPLAGLSWHPAWVERPEPLATLAVCYQSGKLQLMTSIGDETPCNVDRDLPAHFISWNPSGTVLAVTAATPATEENGPGIVTQFFSTEGVHLRTLRVSGKQCGGITWEGGGLRVAIGVDSSVYFANVRPNYKYCYFKKTAVFAFTVPDKVEESVMFWNVNTNERRTKSVRGLQYMNACKDACVLISRPDTTQQQRMIQLVNAIGSPLETRFIDMELYTYDMNSSAVVCCGDESIYIWQFRDPSTAVDALDPISMQASRAESQERVIHVCDLVRGDTAPTMKVRSALTNDLISAMCVSETHMFVSLESGTLHVYQLSPLQLVSKYILFARAQSMSVNCNSTQLAVIHLGGITNVYCIEREKFSLVPCKADTIDGVELKDVWNLRWAVDDPHRFAVMEKTRMLVYNHGVAEEPVQSCANLCKFKSLKIRTLQLDELLLDPERPRKDYIVDFEAQLLRDMRAVLRDGTAKEAYEFAESHNTKKLWELLAEHTLFQLDFTYAEVAFIHCKDYAAIQFVKRVRSLDDPKKQLAEVNAYYRRFDEAERLYKDVDRKDLALDLRYRLGDWFGVVRLVQEGGGDEALLFQAWENIGDHYASRQKWSKAAQYYTQCRHYRKLARIFYIIEDYEMLTQLISMGEHDKELMVTLGNMLLTVGLAEEAAKAFIAANEPRMAVNGCVQVNMWNRAIALAKEHRLEDVGQLLEKYAKYLIHRERLTEAIELYRKAGKHDEAATLLAQLGKRAALRDALKAKKFYVLSALEVQKYRTTAIALNRDGVAVVSEMLNKDRSTVSERTLDAAWRGAEAYHFLLMCQQQMADRNFKAALVLAMRLIEYDDLVAPVDGYSLIALTAYLVKNFGLCSKAFARLEQAERNDEAGGVAAAATTQLENFSLDLDVTHRTMASTCGGSTGGSTGMLSGGGGSALSGTTTSLQLTNPGKGVTRMAPMTYPTVSLRDPPRPFADLARHIFMTHSPVDTSVDSVPCPTCGSFNKEWAQRCIKCQQPFNTCIVSGCAIVSEDGAWQCSVCHRKALEAVVDKYRNCPLCHTPRKGRMRRGI
ncbi:intraflagellar transport protein 122B, putative [Leishmania tarentolae]|uniref:Intraflagellar transport protein 122B, putative n=1 Tax=Leishmania tarentolae TaxID=5689 RepID=A0A640KAU8_LEITA|nr:Chain B, Intraflagellar transport protein 122B, putative [Leishmania tarentolae]8F5P_B Chain B, Intraflagellar transport protein 122B, putative [Leishmania tarentolae]GET86225.1 intraflagellar transport protein 122B, putative [Leishmania tarentolae]